MFFKKVFSSQSSKKPPDRSRKSTQSSTDFSDDFGANSDKVVTFQKNEICSNEIQKKSVNFSENCPPSKAPLLPLSYCNTDELNLSLNGPPTSSFQQSFFTAQNTCRDVSPSTRLDPIPTSRSPNTRGGRSVESLPSLVNDSNTLTIHIERNSQGLGFSILAVESHVELGHIFTPKHHMRVNRSRVYGKCSNPVVKSQFVMVKKVFPLQRAWNAKPIPLQVGDIILSVNATCVTGIHGLRALEVLRTSPKFTVLTVCRLYHQMNPNAAAYPDKNITNGSSNYFNPNFLSWHKRLQLSCSADLLVSMPPPTKTSSNTVSAKENKKIADNSLARSILVKRHVSAPQKRRSFEYSLQRKLPRLSQADIGGFQPLKDHDDFANSHGCDFAESIPSHSVLKDQKSSPATSSHSSSSSLIENHSPSPSIKTSSSTDSVDHHHSTQTNDPHNGLLEEMEARPRTPVFPLRSTPILRQEAKSMIHSLRMARSIEAAAAGANSLPSLNSTRSNSGGFGCGFSTSKRTHHNKLRGARLLGRFGLKSSADSNGDAGATYFSSTSNIAIAKSHARRKEEQDFKTALALRFFQKDSNNDKCNKQASFDTTDEKKSGNPDFVGSGDVNSNFRGRLVAENSRREEIHELNRCVSADFILNNNSDIEYDPSPMDVVLGESLTTDVESSPQLSIRTPSSTSVRSLIGSRSSASPTSSISLSYISIASLEEEEGEQNQSYDKGDI